MKVSEKIKDIIETAHYQFRYELTDHNNDVFSVDVYFQIKVDSGGEWFVSLVKPSQRQLDMMGETWEMDDSGVRLDENECGFMCHSPSLIKALNKLHEKVLDADCWSNR